MRRVLQVFAVLACCFAARTAIAAAPDCPNGGTVNLGAIPAEDMSQLLPIFQRIGALIEARLDCHVIVRTGTSYTAVIEAMRAHRVEVASFGAFSYVLAHEVANAEAVASFAKADGKPGNYFATITTWPGSGITTLQQVKGKAFAFSDPASTSGHLIPSYALVKAGIDPQKDIKPFYTGSHTASFEALHNRKVPVGELNSTAIAGATLAGLYKPEDYVTLWTSPPIPNGPFAVRGDLSPAFKARLTQVLRTLDLSSMPEKDMKFLGRKDSHALAAVDDHNYDSIRDVVSVLHLDLSTMTE
jgi:phosphonate transport system substrate-binding protein